MGDFSKKSFQTYEETLRRGEPRTGMSLSPSTTGSMFSLLPLQHDPRYRIDVVKLLQGDVYDDPDPKVLRSHERNCE